MPPKRTRSQASITGSAAPPEPAGLGGLLAAPDSPTAARRVNGRATYCPGGCGYLTTNCGCPGSPRLNGRRLVTVELPEPVGCPRCRPDGCKGCGYRQANCTCPGGPRSQLRSGIPH